MKLLTLALAAGMLLGGCSEDPTSPAAGDYPAVDGGIASLYARDPLAHTLSFTDGRYGAVFNGLYVNNRSSDIDLDGYYTGEFSVAVEGGREGTIVDIGAPDSLYARYGYTETVGKGDGFASIRVRDGKVMILKNRADNELQELTEGRPLLTMAPQSVAHLPVHQGHIYLIRITDRFDTSYEMLVKLLVLSYQPGESVAFRWQRMQG